MVLASRSVIMDGKAHFVLMCSEVDCSESTSDRAWKLWGRCREYLCQDDLQDVRPWFACVLYVAGHNEFQCGDSKVIGFTSVSMPALMRAASLSPMEFFRLLHDFAKQTALDPYASEHEDITEIWASTNNVVIHHAAERIRRLEVVIILREHFLEIFDDLFPESKRSAGKSSRLRVTREKIKNFAWLLFCLAKARLKSVADNLNASHQLLLVVLLFCYQSAIENPTYINPVFAKPQGPLRVLCKRHGKGSLTLNREVASMVARKWKPLLHQLVRERVLFLGQRLDGCFFGGHDQLAQGTYQTLLDRNMHSVARAYEEFLLEQGLCDERNLLNSLNGWVEKRQGAKSNSPKHSYKRTPHTPRTHSYNEKALLKSIVYPTPDFTKPPPTLLAIVEQLGSSSKDWQGILTHGITTMKQEFHTAATTMVNNALTESDATQQFGISARLYYKALQSILQQELASKESRGSFVNIDALLRSEKFNRSLLACCVEVTLFSYQQSPFHFPWVLDAFKLCPYEFQKVIELAVRSESGFSATNVKHLKSCEELVLQHLIWGQSSSLIAQMKEQAGATSPGRVFPTTLKTTPSPIQNQNQSRPAEAFLSNRSDKGIKIVFRKLYRFSWDRLSQLCKRMGTSKYQVDIASGLLRYALENETLALLADRSIDLLVLCCLHAACTLERSDSQAFADLIEQYKTLPDSKQEYVYKIPLGQHIVDIVAFYNDLFLSAMETALTGLLDKETATSRTVRPLPTLRNKRPHRPRMIARNTAITVSYLSPPTKSLIQGHKSPLASGIKYAFHRSPSKNLSIINQRVSGRGGQRKLPQHVFKRPGETISEASGKRYHSDVLSEKSLKGRVESIRSHRVSDDIVIDSVDEDHDSDSSCSLSHCRY